MPLDRQSEAVVPAFGLRIRVTSDCEWQGHEGQIKRVETSGEQVVHVLLDGEDETRQFWASELTLTEVRS